jgi:glycosyltransferase involved in cell wall biosynthesis
MNVYLEALGIGIAGGGRSSILELIASVATSEQIHVVHVWLDCWEPELSASPKIVQHVVPIRNRWLGRIYASAWMAIFARRERPDLIHFTKNHTLPFMPAPCLVTVHDLANLRQSEIFPGWDTFFWRYIQPIALARANRIVAISNTTAKDLFDIYGIPKTKISVIPWSLRPQFFRVDTQAQCDVRTKYAIDGPYIVHVGAISPKKNLTTLVRAVALMRARGYTGRLVLAGPTYHKMGEDRLEEVIRETRMDTSVMALGQIPDGDVPRLLSAADAFAFPSLYEGFGLAPIEAMACGTPVVISEDGGALLEVMGTAAARFSPIRDHEALAAAIFSVIGERRDEFVSRGYALAASFTRASLTKRMIAEYVALHTAYAKRPI